MNLKNNLQIERKWTKKKKKQLIDEEAIKKKYYRGREECASTKVLCEINQELISPKLLLFRATIWPLKISFAGLCVEARNKWKQTGGEGKGERVELVKKNPLFRCATTDHFHKIFIQRVYGKIENVRQQAETRGCDVELRMAVVTARI